MIRTLLLATLLLAPLAAPLGTASHANACQLGSPGRVTLGNYYLEHRANHDVWVYEETNHVAGLQRGGPGPIGTDHCIDDPLVIPDKIVL